MQPLMDDHQAAPGAPQHPTAVGATSADRRPSLQQLLLGQLGRASTGSQEFGLGSLGGSPMHARLDLGLLDSPTWRGAMAWEERAAPSAPSPTHHLDTSRSSAHAGSALTAHVHGAAAAEALPSPGVEQAADPHSWTDITTLQQVPMGAPRRGGGGGKKRPSDLHGSRPGSASWVPPTSKQLRQVEEGLGNHVAVHGAAQPTPLSRTPLHLAPEPHHQPHLHHLHHPRRPSRLAVAGGGGGDAHMTEAGGFGAPASAHGAPVGGERDAEAPLPDDLMAGMGCVRLDSLTAGLATAAAAAAAAAAPAAAGPPVEGGGDASVVLMLPGGLPQAGTPGSARLLLAADGDGSNSAWAASEVLKQLDYPFAAAHANAEAAQAADAHIALGAAAAAGGGAGAGCSPTLLSPPSLLLPSPPGAVRRQQLPTKSHKAVATGESGVFTSAYRGVTRHKLTGRYEAHLWDSTFVRPNAKKGKRAKGRQVYVGGYETEEEAARAYDRAVIAHFGVAAPLNFPAVEYSCDLEWMAGRTPAEVVAILRRGSVGFARGKSQYRGVTRHHDGGRWEARLGKVAGIKSLYLGSYDSAEEAARAYDRASVKYCGTKAMLNFDLSDYQAILEDPDGYDPTPSPSSDLSVGGYGGGAYGSGAYGGSAMVVNAAASAAGAPYAANVSAATAAAGFAGLAHLLGGGAPGGVTQLQLQQHGAGAQHAPSPMGREQWEEWGAAPGGSSAGMALPLVLQQGLPAGAHVLLAAPHAAAPPPHHAPSGAPSAAPPAGEWPLGPRPPAIRTRATLAAAAAAGAAGMAGAAGGSGGGTPASSSSARLMDLDLAGFLLSPVAKSLLSPGGAPGGEGWRDLPLSRLFGGGPSNLASPSGGIHRRVDTSSSAGSDGTVGGPVPSAGRAGGAAQHRLAALPQVDADLASHLQWLESLDANQLASLFDSPSLGARGGAGAGGGPFGGPGAADN